MEEANLNSLSLYMKEISKNPIPTSEENQALLIRYKNGDQEAYKELFERNLRLVIPYAKYYAKKHEADLLDTIQNGNLGLAKAIEKFDLSFNVKFSTYAVPWIKQSITRKHMDTEQEIRRPVQIIENNSKIAFFIRNYRDKYGVEPTDDEIITNLKITKHYLDQFRESSKFSILSLDEKIKDEKMYSRNTKDTLLAILGKNERDMMTGKEKIKVFKLLKPFYVLSLEKDKTYQKTSFFLH